MKKFRTRHVFFDGGCGFCARTVRVLRFLDWMHRTIRHNVAHDWESIHRQFPQLDLEACKRDFHVIANDGRVFKGFDAYRSLAWVLPLAWPILPVLYLPPVRRLGWRIYRQIADNRRTCGIAPNARKNVIF